MTSIETHCPASVASSKCSHFVKLLMFLFVLAKLLPERHNLYGNSLDSKLKYMREKKKINTIISGSSPPTLHHRPSKGNPGDFTLSVRRRGEVRRFQISVILVPQPHSDHRHICPTNSFRPLTYFSHYLIQTIVIFILIA